LTRRAGRLHIRRVLVAGGLTLVVTSLAGTSGAAAATEVGSNCVATEAVANRTLVQTAKAAPSPTPIVVPTSGVVTRWGVNATPGFLGPLMERLKVLRPTEKPNEFRLVAESLGGAVNAGPNLFETRIPVEAGDHFGAHGAEGTFFCETGSTDDVMGFVEGDAPLGVPVTYNTTATRLVAVSAFVERDGDHDGYGDETQDGCPSSAAFQTACPPPLALSTRSQAGKSAVTILVSTTAEAPVSVAGTVNFTKKAGKAGASAKVKMKTPVKTVKPGTIAAFKLKFPGTLKTALATTPKGRSLKLEVTVTSNNPTGVPASKDLVVKLKGLDEAGRG
jgi:hypothetical protein